MQEFNPAQAEHAEHFVRPRINTLLEQAIKNPLVVLCAGMGYGKTLAVSDFVRENNIPVIWMQFSEFDNVCLSFWENFTRAIEQISKPLAEECKEIGFPDTEDKLTQYFFHRERILATQRYLIVLDDIHLVKDDSVIHFIENIIYKPQANRTLIAICRELPKLNLSGLIVRGLISNLDESDLSFTEKEVTQYLIQQGLTSEVQHLPQIFADTNGWAFILNFLVRILKKTPGYPGYARNYVKQNVFQLMEREAWNVISNSLRHFLVRLSLINRLSADLVLLLAENDETLINEFNQQRVIYVRFDDYSGCYLIHHLFSDYLRSKQDILSPEEIQNTYKTAAEWCVRNDFNIDALTYYEKIGDYASLVTIIYEAPSQMLLSVALHLKEIFDRAPSETFDNVECFACAHVRILMLSGLWHEALDMLKSYEHRFLRLPENDGFRLRSLGVLYYFEGILRQLMCTVDDVYDFDLFYKKMNNYPTSLPPGQVFDNYPIGPWINRVGIPRKGAPQEYLEALKRSAEHIADGATGWMDGQSDLCLGELLFFQGDIDEAQSLFSGVLESVDNSKQFALIHFVQCYALRIAAWQGSYVKTQQAVTDMELALEENEYSNRFSTYDIILGMYYYILRQPEKIPGWLKGKISPYSPTNFLENMGSMMKLRYHYLTKKHTVLLTYFEDQKRREIPLYGRIEMLAMEACTHYQMKDKQKAYDVLQEAYDAASPNDIVSPFVELGKDMRTLTLTARRDPKCSLPEDWLRNINYKSSVYARHQTLLISEYKMAHNINVGVKLSHRETEVLYYLYNGFSRSEIAANQDLSINTVRLIINTIYEKLQARNIADLIRIVHEQELI